MIKLVGESLKQYDLNRQVEIIPVGDVLEVKMLSKSPNALPVCFEEGFGETTVMGDTLTWDGNTEGYKVEANNGDGTYAYYYHVSDATPTLDDFVNGMSYTMVVDGAGEITESVEYSADSFMDIGGGALWTPFGVVIPTDNHSDSGITFEKKGCYFTVTDSAKAISATINNYTGFETTTPVPRIFACIPDILLKSSGVITVETLEMLDDGSQIEQRMTFTVDKAKKPEGYECPKPEILTPNYLKNNSTGELPFGETTVMGDTLTWDGNTEGLYSFMDMFYHVSDVVPTLEELQHGGSVVTETNTITFDGNAVLDMGTGIIVVADNILIVTMPNADFQGVIAEKAGIYFPSPENVIITAFTINSYTGFEGTVITPIDKKFLPESEMVINLSYTIDGSNTCTVDKTFDEIMNAHNNGITCTLLDNRKIIYRIFRADVVDDSVVFVGFSSSDMYICELHATKNHEYYQHSI